MRHTPIMYTPQYEELVMYVLSEMNEQLSQNRVQINICDVINGEILSITFRLSATEGTMEILP